MSPRSRVRGEAAVRDYAIKLDKWSGDIVVAPEEIERRTRDVPGSSRRISSSRPVRSGVCRRAARQRARLRRRASCQD